MHETVNESKQKPGRELYEWVQALVSSVLTVVIVFTFFVRVMGVDGVSMIPTLQSGDRMLVVNSLLYDSYRYGDIIVLRKESFLETPIVKRVIATEGQSVDLDIRNGIVYVDGQMLQEPYINELTFTTDGTQFPLVVPKGSVFVMGDNRNHSNDSRDIRLGTVDTRYVIGKAAMIVFPGKNAATEAREWTRIGVIWE